MTANNLLDEGAVDEGDRLGGAAGQLQAAGRLPTACGNRKLLDGGRRESPVVSADGEQLGVDRRDREVRSESPNENLNFRGDGNRAVISSAIDVQH